MTAVNTAQPRNTLSFFAWRNNKRDCQKRQPQNNNKTGCTTPVHKHNYSNKINIVNIQGSTICGYFHVCLSFVALTVGIMCFASVVVYCR